jgi:hypothetical protein
MQGTAGPTRRQEQEHNTNRYFQKVLHCDIGFFDFRYFICKRAQKELAPILSSAEKFYAKITISFVTTSIFTKKNLTQRFSGNFFTQTPTAKSAWSITI